jgi:hypothetical protein
MATLAVLTEEVRIKSCGGVTVFCENRVLREYLDLRGYQYLQKASVDTYSPVLNTLFSKCILCFGIDVHFLQI